MTSVEDEVAVWLTEVALDDLDALGSLTLLLITGSRPLLLTQFELESLGPERDTSLWVSTERTLEDSGSRPSPAPAFTLVGPMGAGEPLLNFSPLLRERGAETMASSEVSAALPPAAATLASAAKSLPFVRFVRAPFKISAGVGGGGAAAGLGAPSFCNSGADCCAVEGACCVGGCAGGATRIWLLEPSMLFDKLRHCSSSPLAVNCL